MNQTLFTLENITDKIIRPCLLKTDQRFSELSLLTDLNETVLFGAEGAILDSLNLVAFIFLIEEQVQAVFKMDIKFTPDDILNNELAPFLSVKNMGNFVRKKLVEGT